MPPPRRRTRAILESALIAVGVIILIAGLTKLAPVAPALVGVLRALLHPLVLVPLAIGFIWVRATRKPRG